MVSFIMVLSLMLELQNELIEGKGRFKILVAIDGSAESMKATRCDIDIKDI